MGSENLVNLLDPLGKALISASRKVVNTKLFGKLLNVRRSLGAESDALESFQLSIQLSLALFVCFLRAHLVADLIAETFHLALELLVLSALSGVALKLSLHALQLLNVAINAFSILSQAAALLFKILSILSLLVFGFIQAADLRINVLLITELMSLRLIA